MWKLGLRPRYSFSGNICFEISVFFGFAVYDVTCLTCKPGDGGGRGGGGGGCGGEVVPAPGPQPEQTACRIDRGGINLPRLPFLIHVLLLRILNLKIPSKRERIAEHE
jgi:hypothetical protein